MKFTNGYGRQVAVMRVETHGESGLKRASVMTPGSQRCRKRGWIELRLLAQRGVLNVEDVMHYAPRTLIACVLAASLFFAACKHQHVSGPSREEYTVYSAFIKELAASKQLFGSEQLGDPELALAIVDKTVVAKNDSTAVLPLDFAAIGTEELGQDYFQQNAKSWRLEPRFEIPFKYGLISADTIDRKPLDSSVSPAGHRRVSGVLRLSRVGFDRKRIHGLLSYSYECGALCGRAGIVMLQKNESGWSVKEFGKTLVF
jgi:hypothetical protein